MYRFVFFIFFCKLGLLKCTAENVRRDYEHYTVNNGMATQTTYNVVQDRKGFLWVATDAGASCFDGKKFINYTMDDGLGDNEVLNVFEDKSGRIWFFPFSGQLSYYQEGKFFNESNTPLLKKLMMLSKFLHPVEDYQGNIYAVSKESECKLIRLGADNSIRKVDLSHLLKKQDGIKAIYRSPDQKRIYCLTKENRLFIVSERSVREIRLPASAIAGSVYWYSNLKWPERITGLDDKGVLCFNDSLPVRLMHKSALSGLTHFFSVVLDKYRNLWIADYQRNSHLFRYSNGGYQTGMPVLKDVFSITSFDDEDNVWFCTGNEGLYKIPYKKLAQDSSLYFTNSLLQKNILCTCRDEEGNLWIGYSNGYLTQVTGEKIIHHNLNFGSRSYNRVLQVLADNDGDIWCATDETCIMLRRKGKGDFASPRHMVMKRGSNFIMATKAITLDRNGTVYVTTSLDYIRVDKGNIEGTSLAWLGNRGERNYSSFFNSRNRCYISTFSGLHFMKGDSMQNLAKLDVRLNTRFQHFAENSSSVIFLASYSEGIIALKNNKVLDVLRKKEGLAGVICRRIYVVNDTLYIATNGGISIAVFERNSFRVLRNLSLVDGLPSLDVNDLVISGGDLHAATSEGMGFIRLRAPGPKLAPPPTLSILAFRVNDSMLSLNGPIVFPYKQQSVRIDFIAPVMEKPDMVNYRYRFSGRDETWQNTLSSRLEFSDLPYGEFVMEIQARKYNSGWSPSKTIAFIITPPFYSTWWFRIIALGSWALILFFIIRSVLTKRFRQQLAESKQKEAIEKERNRIAADIHDDIGAELTSIVIHTRILKSGLHENNEFQGILHKLERFSNEAINKMNEVIWTLNASNDTLYNLAAYLRNYIGRLLEENGLKGKICIADNVYVEKSIKADLSRSVFLIIKEALHNVLKHSGTDRVEIYLALQSDDEILLQIRDYGKGFDPDKTAGGNGLLNMRKRSQALNGRLSLESQHGSGCAVNVYIPL